MKVECLYEPPQSSTETSFRFLEDPRHDTVEALANELAKLCLEDKNVQRVIVRVEKPGAVRFAESVGVEIERNR